MQLRCFDNIIFTLINIDVRCTVNNYIRAFSLSQFRNKLVSSRSKQAQLIFSSKYPGVRAIANNSNLPESCRKTALPSIPLAPVTATRISLTFGNLHDTLAHLVIHQFYSEIRTSQLLKILPPIFKIRIYQILTVRSGQVKSVCS